jgi:predicted protein tyrosine phosphatase
MIAVEICSHATARGLVVTNPGVYDLILITNSLFAPCAEDYADARRWLHLEFDDIHAPLGDLRMPTAESVRRALDWSAGSEHLVVACHAGISRSSALAYVLCCRDRTPQQALAILERGRHHPNALIVRLGADLLQRPEIYDVYWRWLSGSGVDRLPGEFPAE